MKFNYTKVPIELKELKRWVLWKIKTNEKGKNTKVPINALNGYGAKSNDPSTWCEFEIALKNIKKYNCVGLGFMLGNGYFGVDLDNSEEDNQAEFEKIKNHFIKDLNSYTEYSQSGLGIHIICKGVLPIGTRRKGKIEMYDSARYFAITGNVVENTTTNINERTQTIKKLHEFYFKTTPTKYTFKKENEPRRSISLSDEEIIKKASESNNGSLFNCLYFGQWESLYSSQSEADMAFCSMLAFWTGKNKDQMDRMFRCSQLYRDKWDQQRGQNTYGEKTLQAAINRCIDVYAPSFNVGVQTYNPSTGTIKNKKTYSWDDTGNAQRFVDMYGEKIRYNFDNKKWMIYDGKTWKNDTTQFIKKLADLMIIEIKKEAVEISDKELSAAALKNVKRVASSSGKEAMLKEAMHIDNVPTTNADYDNDPFLLNCSNGIVDLRTGEIMNHNKNFMLSKNTNVAVDYDNPPKLWLRFLDDLFSDDAELYEYIQRIAGYTLTGSIKEQCLFQCCGNGSNGKSVFFNALYEILGTYATNIQIETILVKPNNGGSGASSDIARLKGVRLVRTNEPSEGARFNEGLVKQITGCDPITARFLYGSEFEFKPIFKLWIACNNKIEVRGTDKGIWRRMRNIDFNKTFEGDKADKELESKIKKELSQILAWAIKGAVAWYKNGLKTPKSVQSATEQYRQENNVVEKFIKERVIRRKGYREKASDVFMAYKMWAKNGNEWIMSQSKFGIELSKKFKKQNISGYVIYLDIQIKKNERLYTFNKDYE